MNTQTEDHQLVLTYEVSDEALESAAMVNGSMLHSLDLSNVTSVQMRPSISFGAVAVAPLLLTLSITLGDNAQVPPMSPYADHCSEITQISHRRIL